MKRFNLEITVGLFVILGIIGTYIARIHTALQNRPRFVIQKLVNFD